MGVSLITIKRLTSDCLMHTKGIIDIYIYTKD